VEEPEAFWLDQAAALDWFERPARGLASDERGIQRWFPDGVLNTAYLALDAHVDGGRGEQTALIYDSPVTDTLRHYSYLELRDEVALCAGMLRALGVEKGDRVLIYMP